MEVKKITTEIHLYSWEEIPVNIKTLLERAKESGKNAYAPYSKFQVGAAILLDSGQIITGNNQENACYPCGLCAERVAVFSAKAKYPNSTIIQLAITAKPIHSELSIPVPPCGSCRQVLAEYERTQKHPIEVWFRGSSGPVAKVDSVTTLLPLTFNDSFLDR